MEATIARIADEVRNLATTAPVQRSAAEQVIPFVTEGEPNNFASF